MKAFSDTSKYFAVYSHGHAEPLKGIATHDEAVQESLRRSGRARVETIAVPRMSGESIDWARGKGMHALYHRHIQENRFKNEAAAAGARAENLPPENRADYLNGEYAKLGHRQSQEEVAAERETHGVREPAELQRRADAVLEHARRYLPHTPPHPNAPVVVEVRKLSLSSALPDPVAAANQAYKRYW